MYIDDGSAGDPGELTIDVDGHEYTEAENFSYQHDGVVDSVAVDEADGGHVVYTDTGHTGHADLVTEYDAHGTELRAAHFDQHSGAWLDDGPAQDPTAGADGQAADQAGTTATATISVDTPDGPRGIGPATVDTNDDGHPDTAVVHDANGNTVLYTDSHGTGQADVATEITPDGHVVIAEHTGPHRWTTVERGHLESGQYQRDAQAGGEFTPTVGADGSGVRDTADDANWGADAAASDESGWAGAFSGRGSAQGVVRIDANTGQWISSN